MKPGSSRRVFAAALLVPLALAACDEKASPESAPAATTAAPTATATATATSTETATATSTETATATATATAEPQASGVASAKPTATTTAKAATKPPPTPKTATPESTASASASGTAAPAATAVEIAPPKEGSADAIAQKVDALAHRTEPQARDVFDLAHLLARPGADRLAWTNELASSRDAAIEHAMGISYDAFVSKVVAYLDPEQMPLYESRAAWDSLQASVVDELERTP